MNKMRYGSTRYDFPFHLKKKNWWENEEIEEYSQGNAGKRYILLLFEAAIKARRM